ncbi:MAG: hypothetical protein EP329_02415 [Deltaproteobacteria bacterium]|nr:MAG: hypothetical protein EP329_02415 [Deltaproteobacteria bacterium]
MRLLRPILLSSALSLATAAGALSGCSKPEPDVVIVHEGDEDVKEVRHLMTEEEGIEQRQQERMKEPELDAESPREQLQLVWGRGEKLLRSIQHERFDIFQQMRNMKLEEKDDKKEVEALVELMSEWTVGREAAEMETAADRLCKLIEAVRPRAEAMMGKATEELTKIQAVTDELDKKVAEGGTVYQKQWDKLDKERARWSAPLQAGRFAFLAIKSMFDEAHVLADLGARRSQKALTACLSAYKDKPLPLDLAQQQLEKVLERAQYYR